MALADSTAPLAAAPLAIEVVVGLAPRLTRQVMLSLPAGSTVKQALDAAQVWGMAGNLSPDAIEAGTWSVGVWGRKERLSQVLRDRDRIELVRPLIVDPKEARRVRYRKHGEKLPKGIHRPKAR